MITSFHEDMHGTVQYDRSSSKAFPIRNGVKQESVLAPILFEIFFSLLPSYALGSSSEGVCLYSRTDGKLFNLVHMRAETKVRQVAPHRRHIANIVQLAQACTEFGLTISLKKAYIVGQEISEVPAISTDDHTLEVVQELRPA